MVIGWFRGIHLRGFWTIPSCLTGSTSDGNGGGLIYHCSSWPPVEICGCPYIYIYYIPLYIYIYTHAVKHIFISVNSHIYLATAVSKSCHPLSGRNPIRNSLCMGWKESHWFVCTTLLDSINTVMFLFFLIVTVITCNNPYLPHPPPPHEWTTSPVLPIGQKKEQGPGQGKGRWQRPQAR